MKFLFFNVFSVFMIIIEILHISEYQNNDNFHEEIINIDHYYKKFHL